jgi:hypothetical protein
MKHKVGSAPSQSSPTRHRGSFCSYLRIQKLHLVRFPSSLSIAGNGRLRIKDMGLVTCSMGASKMSAATSFRLSPP